MAGFAGLDSTVAEAGKPGTRNLASGFAEVSEVAEIWMVVAIFPNGNLSVFCSDFVSFFFKGLSAGAGAVFWAAVMWSKKGVKHAVRALF